MRENSICSIIVFPLKTQTFLRRSKNSDIFGCILHKTVICCNLKYRMEITVSVYAATSGLSPLSKANIELTSRNSKFTVFIGNRFERVTLIIYPQSPITSRSSRKTDLGIHIFLNIGIWICSVKTSVPTFGQRPAN